ncbi:MAG: hypothetical protein ACXAEF_01240 [Candidatus Thorarchaeota archaeon]
MSEVLTIVMFVSLMFLILVYGSGVLDTHLRGHRIYVEDLDRQLMASDARSAERDPDELLYRSWRGSGSTQVQFLYGCQGVKKHRRQSTHDID